jgi:trk system potassium uptake protein TrkA
MYVIIAGINSTSERLVQRLENSHDVVVIDPDEDECDRLYSSSGATVINRSPSTIAALQDAGVSQADIIIAAGRNDNENMVVCSLARKFGVPKIVSRVEDNEYVEAFDLIDAETVSHNDVLVSQFLSAVEHPSVIKLSDLEGGLEAVKVKVGEKSGQEVSSLEDSSGFPDGFQVSTVLRGDQQMGREAHLQKGDRLLMVGPQEEKPKLDSFFSS